MYGRDAIQTWTSDENDAISRANAVDKRRGWAREKREGGAITIGYNTYRRSIGRIVLWCTRSSRCPSSDCRYCCRCHRYCGTWTSDRILCYAPWHKIHQAGYPADLTLICNGRSHSYLRRICDKISNTRSDWTLTFEQRLSKISIAINVTGTVQINVVNY